MRGTSKPSCSGNMGASCFTIKMLESGQDQCLVQWINVCALFFAPYHTLNARTHFMSGGSFCHFKIVVVRLVNIIPKKSWKTKKLCQQKTPNDIQIIRRSCRPLVLSQIWGPPAFCRELKTPWSSLQIHLEPIPRLEAHMAKKVTIFLRLKIFQSKKLKQIASTDYFSKKNYIQVKVICFSANQRCPNSKKSESSRQSKFVTHQVQGGIRSLYSDIKQSGGRGDSPSFNLKNCYNDKPWTELSILSLTKKAWKVIVKISEKTF